jgi:hypothetical protein
MNGPFLKISSRTNKNVTKTIDLKSTGKHQLHNLQQDRYNVKQGEIQNYILEITKSRNRTTIQSQANKF